MTAHQKVVVWITCNGCNKPCSLKGDLIAEVRKSARKIGWKTGRHPRARHTPRFYDACENCQVPEGYDRI